MFAELRRRLWTHGACRPEAQRRARSRISPELRMVDVDEHRILRRRARVACHELLESLVRTPHHLLGGEGGRDGGESARRDPPLQQLADLLAPAPTVALIVEVKPQPG